MIRNSKYVSHQMFLQNAHIYLHIYAQSAMGKLNEMCNLMSRGNTHVFICANRQKVILLQYIVLFEIGILYKTNKFYPSKLPLGTETQESSDTLIYLEKSVTKL